MSEFDPSRRFLRRAGVGILGIGLAVVAGSSVARIAESFGQEDIPITIPQGEFDRANATIKNSPLDPEANDILRKELLERIKQSRIQTEQRNQRQEGNGELLVVGTLLTSTGVLTLSLLEGSHLQGRMR